MAPVRVLGTILVVIGIVALIFGGISWTREKTLIDLGPIEAKTETRERLPLPPILGRAALAAGVILLVLPARRRT